MPKKAPPQPLAEPAEDAYTVQPYTSRWLVYGPGGTMKSTFAATFPKPMLVFFFDPFGKEMPYRRMGYDGGVVLDEFGTPTRTVLAPDGTVDIQIEHYIDADPTQPEAFSRFRSRLTRLQAQYGLWSTVVLDSTTFFELAARKQSEYKTNPTAKDGRQHYGASANAVEEIIAMRFGALPMNVIVISHINHEKDDVAGSILYYPALPGQQAFKVPAGYPEVYYAFVESQGGTNTFLMQTQRNARYTACSQIPAPNPCPPDYESLWR